jgi:hypothetical protein
VLLRRYRESVLSGLADLDAAPRPHRFEVSYRPTANHIPATSSGRPAGSVSSTGTPWLPGFPNAICG